MQCIWYSGMFFKNEEFDNLILMDGDGEDRPEEIKSLIEKIKENLEKYQ